MESIDASFNWELQDELLAALEADSPLGTAHTLWDDINQSEGDMLETTPASKFSRGDHKFIWEMNAKDGAPSELIHEDSSHIKRRRMLQFEGEEDVGLFACDASLETSPFGSLENYRDIYGAPQNEDAQMLETTSTFDNNAGDNPNMERCNDSSWMGGSFREKECESQWFIEREDRHGLPRIIESTICDTKMDEGKSSRRREINTVSHLKRTLSGQSMSPAKMGSPVAYPFAVVKPSGMQGDVTLNDINKRIMMAHDQPRGRERRNASMEVYQSGADGVFTPNLLAKSVVALTKIHTEGHGTITIMRTKN